MTDPVTSSRPRLPPYEHCLAVTERLLSNGTVEDVGLARDPTTGEVEQTWVWETGDREAAQALLWYAEQLVHTTRQELAECGVLAPQHGTTVALLIAAGGPDNPFAP